MATYMSEAESLALFGQPLSELQVETSSDGQSYTVQWFERARFEDHGSQGVLLGLYKTSLSNWQSTVHARSRAELRSLLLRLAILLVVLGVVFAFSELWRKTIYRYVHDPRRRYQFLLLRKIVLWFTIVIIVAFAFATQRIGGLVRLFISCGVTCAIVSEAIWIATSHSSCAISSTRAS